MNDTIIRATAADDQIRIYGALTTKMCEHAREIHGLSPAVTVALGRLLTAGALMGSMMKNDDEVLSLQVKGDGPLQGMTVTANAKPNVKGFAHNPTAQSSDPLIVKDIMGEGFLTVVKDFGLKEPYVGTSPLVSGEIAEDLTYYYAMSEQIPTSIALGVTLTEDGAVEVAGGFVLQLMPDADDTLIDRLESRLIHSPSVTELLSQGHGARELLQILFAPFGLKINDELPTRFECDCTKEKVIKALVAVGEKDLQEMIDEDQPVTIKCDFCSQEYVFEPAELSILLQAIKGKGKEKEEPLNEEE